MIVVLCKCCKKEQDLWTPDVRSECECSDLGLYVLALHNGHYGTTHTHTAIGFSPSPHPHSHSRCFLRGYFSACRRSPQQVWNGVVEVDLEALVEQ